MVATTCRRNSRVGSDALMPRLYPLTGRLGAAHHAQRSPFHREHPMSAAAPVGRRHAPGPNALTDTARALAAARVIADQAFSRAAGAPLLHGNSVQILKDGAEN